MHKRKKIMMVAMPSLHFFRWVEQLKESDFEVYWFDITGAGNFIERISWVHQITDWKMRWDFPGRIFIKSKFTSFYSVLAKLNERKVAKEFEKVIAKVQPDIVHSFALYVACTPILKVMQKNSQLKWIYSSWGSDLYYYQNLPNYLEDIKHVLQRIDYLITDCKRDFEIAKNYGFNGSFLGVFPGGGGFDFQQMQALMLPRSKRNMILVKGYHGRSGRAIAVLKAIQHLEKEIQNFSIVVFGADPEVFEWLKETELINWNNFKVLGKISHTEVLKLMGRSKIYIGNSNSDGMPNTLLEAICMDVFPIQSNPGGATSEVIQDGKNGLLISNCEDVEEIRILILQSFKKNIYNNITENSVLKKTLDFENVKISTIKAYQSILKQHA